MIVLIPVAAIVLLGWGVPELLRRGSSHRNAHRLASTTAHPWSAAATGPERSSMACGRALARMWSRELVRSGAFQAGLGFCVAIFALLTVVFPEEGRRTWAETFQLAPWFAHPLVGLTVVAMHRAVTRAPRDELDELIGTCPLRHDTRTLGFLGAVWVPVVVFVVFFAAFVATTELVGPAAVGPIGWAPLDLGSAVLLIAGGVGLGVALGGWAPATIVPVLAVIAIGGSSLHLATTGDPGWNPLAELSTLPPMSDIGPLFSPRPYGWHVLWLVGLTAIVVGLAVAKHRRDLLVVSVVVVGAVVAVAGGVGATRPVPGGAAARVAALISNPEANQSCRSNASGSVRVCTYDGYGEPAGAYLAAATAVADAVPGTQRRLVVRQGLSSARDIEDLAPAIRRLLPADDPLGGDDGAIVIGLGPASDDRRLFVRLAVGFTAVGLPVDPPEDDVPLVVAGQSRAVIGFWLATAGLDVDDAARALRPDDTSRDEPEHRGALWPGTCVVPPAVASAQDLAAARSLVLGDRARVAAVVSSAWEHWIDPTTGTDELLGALGMAPVGPFDVIEARPFATGC